MRNTTPRQLAILASALIAAVLLVAFAILDLSGFNFSWLLIVIIIPLVFGCSYYVILYFVRRFIDNRIQVIYKTIHSLKRGNNTEGFKQLPIDSDLVAKVQKEVIDWAKNHVTELEDLRKLEDYRREFLANVSHELKTPIFNIQGYVMTLLEGGLEDPNINRNYLQRAEKGIDRMINIIDDLEAISRLESGELALDKSAFDIVELARDVLDAQEMKAGQRRIKLLLRDEQKRTVRVMADKNLIRQVLSNLVVNSIKYGKDDGQTEIRFYDMDENILVEVADNGLGISKEHLPRLFERFYRVDKGRSREQGGTGLGLAIVKHIIEAHEQTINVRSTEGVGSTFSFTLAKGS